MATPTSNSTSRPSKLLAEWFWTDRWIGSSAFGLPLEARGLYREMLTQAWRRGARLPNDHDQIRRMAGITKSEWRRAWPLVARFWRVDGDALVNDTQIEVYTDAAARTERASKRGLSGAQALLKRRLSAAQAQPEHQPPSPSLSLSPNVPSVKNTDGTARARAVDPPMDVWFEDLKREYPPEAVSSGHLTMTAFMDAVVSKGTPLATFTVMLLNLDNQKRGHQWRVKKMIPRLDKWLREGLWEQQHDEHPVSTLVSDKTVRTLASGDQFVRGGER